jgi:hypothetical protein
MFGVIGGYGSTGRVVVSELQKGCQGEILIGGRDLVKGKRFSSRVRGQSVGREGAFCMRCHYLGFSGGRGGPNRVYGRTAEIWGRANRNV